MLKRTNKTVSKSGSSKIAYNGNVRGGEVTVLLGDDFEEEGVGVVVVAFVV